MMQMCTTAELLAVLLARDLKDGERGAAGAAALVPMAAILLAINMHAPNIEIAGEMFVNPRPKQLWESMLDDRALGVCEASETFIELFGHSHAGLDFFFHSGLQCDAYGNINLHVIGPWDRPQLRGPGAANISYAIRSKRFYITALTHTRRNFVQNVDFTTIAGNLSGPDAKQEAGLTTEGPRYCLTPRCIFDFDPVTLRMRIKSVHPGHSVDEIIAETGFDLDVPAAIEWTVLPSREELEILRRVVDPKGALRHT